MNQPVLRAAMSLLLGAWLMGTIVTGFVAAENFWIIDRLVPPAAHPTFQRDLERLDAQTAPGEGRTLLRYLSSEMNRLYFRVWGACEAIFGIAILAMALRSRQKSLIAGFSLMLAMVAATELFLTPRIVAVGRELDFVPRDPPPPQSAAFGMLHGVYSTLDLVKLLVGFWMAWALLRLAGRDSQSPEAEDRS